MDAAPTQDSADGPESSLRPVDASAIARHVVQTLHEYTGRGPTKVRAHVSDGCITVVTEGMLTKGELVLAANDRQEAVAVGRDAFQAVFEAALIAGVERVTGRQVRTMLSANDIDSDIGVEVFILGATLPGGD